MLCIPHPSIHKHLTKHLLLSLAALGTKFACVSLFREMYAYEIKRNGIFMGQIDTCPLRLPWKP